MYMEIKLVDYLHVQVDKPWYNYSLLSLWFNIVIKVLVNILRLFSFLSYACHSLSQPCFGKYKSSLDQMKIVRFLPLICVQGKGDNEKCREVVSKLYCIPLAISIIA